MAYGTGFGPRTYILAVEYDSEGHNSRPDPVLEFPPAAFLEIQGGCGGYSNRTWSCG